MNPLGYIVMLGWIPAVLMLFGILPPRRAAVAAVVAGWLLLPNTAFGLPGFPDYTKTSATTVGVLLASALLDPGRLTGTRLRWFDLPILTWCVVPLASSLANGLGLYDGLSSSLAQTVTWGLPYLVGRAYFGTLEGLRELALGVLIGGLAYVLPCLFEARMSPKLNSLVYGFSSDWVTAYRYGGWRPAVFLSNGLELGMWMTAASLVGYWMWASGALRKCRGIPFGWVLAVLLATTVWCKSTGALLLLAVGMAVLWIAAHARSSLPVWILLLVPPLYMGSRATGTWSGANAVEMVTHWINAERAGSFEFRLRNENMLAAKALQRPVLGWGGWGRNRVYDENGRDISITDGFWIIALGTNGIVGLVSVTTALLLPVLLLMRRDPVRRWRDADVAPAAALAVLLLLYMIDSLSNGMLNPIYLLAAGGLVGLPDGRRSGVGVPAGEDEATCLHDALHSVRLARAFRSSTPREAEAAWAHALSIWKDLAARYPDDLELRLHLAVTLNDLAWSLANEGPPATRNAVRAVQFAEEAVALAPDHAPYWNTLGAAYQRAGDPAAAIRALQRAAELGFGGNGFDYVFLALAHATLGDPAGGQAWLDHADAWIASHPAAAGAMNRFRTEAANRLAAMPSGGAGPS